MIAVVICALLMVSTAALMKPTILAMRKVKFSTSRRHSVATGGVARSSSSTSDLDTPPATEGLNASEEVEDEVKSERKYKTPLGWWDPTRAIGSDVRGVTLPLESPWDPLELASNYDTDNKENSNYRRYLEEAERKHGRVCMVAFVGIFFGNLQQILTQLQQQQRYYTYFGGLPTMERSRPRLVHD